MDNRLTPEQEEIIKSDKEIKRVIACAGSGKTFVITRHIIDLIEKGHALPGEILAITFTRNAAENMRERIGLAIEDPDISAVMDIMTFNSFGDEIIRENSLKMGLGKDVRLINYSESWQMIYEIISSREFRTLKIGKDLSSLISQVLSYILELKKNLIRTVDMNSYSSIHESIMSRYESTALRSEEEEIFSYQEELFSIYRQYEKAKLEKNLIDYTDQVFLPYYLFLGNKDVLEKYRMRYKYIFIDEFQDTDLSQGRLLGLLYKKGINKMVFVGDDDQGIYSFRGACIENSIGLDRWRCFKGSDFGDFYLSRNFRSGKCLTDAFSSLLSNNENRLEKRLLPKDPEHLSEICHFSFDTHSQEAKAISSIIKRLIKKGVRPKDIAILSRVKRFEMIKKSLEAENIPFESLGSKRLFVEPEIQILTSWLMVIYDIESDLEIIKILQSEKYKVSYKDLAIIRCTRRNVPLIKALIASSEADISRQAKKRISGFLEDLRYYISISNGLKLRELIETVYSRSGLEDELLSGFGPAFKRKIQNVKAFMRLASDFELDREGRVFKTFIIYLRDTAKKDSEDPETADFALANSVKLMSVHAAKGLEFEVVIIPFLWKSDFLNKRNNAGKFKIPASLKKDDAIDRNKPGYSSKKGFKAAKDRSKDEEERRIFYVACSRAKKLLILTHSHYMTEDDMKEDKREKEKVPYLDQLLDGTGYCSDIENIKVYANNENGDYFGNIIKAKNTLEFIRHAESRLLSVFEKKGTDKKHIKEKAFEYIKSINDSYPHDLDLRSVKLRSTRKAKDILTKSPVKITSNIYPLSAILDYLNCPRSYYLRYIKRLPERLSSSMVFGQQVHELIMMITSFIYKEKVFGDQLAKEKKRPSDLVEKLLKDLSKDHPTEVLDIVRGLEETGIFYVDDISDLKLEQLYYLSSGSFFVTSQPDRIDFISDKRTRLYEYKSSYSYGSNMGRYLDQIKAYNLLINKVYGVPCQKIESRIIFIKEKMVKKPDITKKDIQVIEKKLQAALVQISNGDFTIKDKKVCDKCDFENICR